MPAIFEFETFGIAVVPPLIVFVNDICMATHDSFLAN